VTLATMGDAAYATNLDGTSFDIVAGYYGGPDAYHTWPAVDWERFPGYRLPIWVGGTNGAGEGETAWRALHDLGVPKGAVTALDMETRQDRTYVDLFGSTVMGAGYKVWVYGSASTVGANPPLNGYWVASYGISMTEVERLLTHPHTRAVQYASGPLYDRSLVKQWTEGEMWHG
jgi:hypothetical protein